MAAPRARPDAQNDTGRAATSHHQRGHRDGTLHAQSLKAVDERLSNPEQQPDQGGDRDKARRRLHDLRPLRLETREEPVEHDPARVPTQPFRVKRHQATATTRAVADCGYSTTSIVPDMSGWNEQWYSYFPGASKITFCASLSKSAWVANPLLVP